MSVDFMIDRLGKLVSRPLMSGKTRPVSIRLVISEIEQLHARAHTLSATIAGLTRDLIRTRELAVRFIPPSSDPMWTQAAQEIFLACSSICRQPEARSGVGSTWNAS
jgi:hypothetical protein